MLATKTILGAGWTVSARLSGRAIDIVTMLVLARALTPADFGLTALAGTLVLILDAVLEIPLILVLTSLKTVTRSHLDTAFTLGFLRGASLTAILLVASWPFALSYGDNRLPALIAAMALGPVARSLYSPGMVQHVREISFRQSFTAELVGRVIASALAILTVYLGGGYWGIVVNNACSSIATTVISYILAPYRPRFSLARFSDLSSFLGWFSTAQIFKAISWQFDRVLLGYYITKSDLGQYTTASDLAIFPMQSLIGPAMQPLMAAFSRIKEDRERLCSAYLNASRLTMMMAAPTCIGISLTSDLVVDVLLGAKWTETGVYLQWLSAALLLNAFYQPMHSLALATRRTDLVFRLSVAEACSRIVLVLAGLQFFDVIGVIASRGAMSLVMFVLSMFSARYMIGATLLSQLKNLWRVAAASVAMAAIVLMVRHELRGRELGDLTQLALIAALGAAVYAATLSALGVRIRHYLSGLGASR